MKEVELQSLRRQFAKLYKPDDAFGNDELMRIVRRIDEITTWIESTDVCFECDGTGESLHECNCRHCDRADDECDECFGEGRISKAV